MVRIRLRRTGLKNQSSYRIMAAEKESPRDGRFLEILGHYNPRNNPSTVEIKEDRVYDWMSKGAQPSESVVRVFNSVGLMDRFARYKAGESAETLLAEAKIAYERHAKGENPDGSTVVKKATISKKAAKKAAAPKEEVKPEAKKEEKPEVKEETKAEEKPEVKEEAKAEEKPEVQATAVVEVAGEVKTEQEPEAEAPVAETTEAEATDEKPAEEENNKSS